MIRVLLGSALPVLGLGVAATFLAPDLVTGPRGEPLVMTAAPVEARLQAASFDGEPCPSTLLLADSAALDAAGDNAHIVAFALRSGSDDFAVAVEDYAEGTGGRETIILLFDEAGRLTAADALGPMAADAACADAPPPAPPVADPV